MITEYRKIIFSMKFVSGLEDFEHVKSGNTVILSGDIVFVTTDEDKNPGPEFVYLGERHPSYSLKDRVKLYVWVQEVVFVKTQEIGRVRLVLAHDYYLRWGMLHYKDVILVGGAISRDSTNLEFYRFEKGSLVEVSEYTLPHIDAPQFNVDLHDRLAQIRNEYDDVRIEWLPPLPSVGQILEDYDVKITKSVLFHLPVIKTVHLKKQTFPKNIISSAILSFLVIFGAYSYITYNSWLDYVGVKKEFKQRIKGYEKTYYNNKYNLKLLEERKKYMAKKIPYMDKIDFMNKFAAYLASKRDLVVKQIEVSLDKNVSISRGRRRITRNRNVNRYDFSVVFHVPMAPNLNALEQSELMLKDIARNFNVIVELANYKSLQVKNAKYKNRRMFEIKGYL